MPLLDDYLKASELAKELGLSRRTLDRWRWTRQGPPIVTIGKRVFYRKDSVREWLEGREQPMVREPQGRRKGGMPREGR